MVEKKYVDVNVFVYWLGKHPKLGEKAREWIRKIETSRRGEYMTSSLTLYETVVIMAGLTDSSLRNLEFVKTVIGTITSLMGLEITPLEDRDLINAIELMKRYNLDYEDAIHLVVALRSNAISIISNDKDFEKTTLKREF